MRIKQVGLPYMGSKRRLSEKIIDEMIGNHIKRHSKHPKYLYDVFGGGGAISLEAIQHHYFKKVYYNDLGTGVTLLLKEVISKGVSDKFHRWVSSEEFKKSKNNKSWYGGFLSTCWSFGSNQKSYMYGKHKEDLQRLFFDYIVDDCLTAKEELLESYQSLPTKQISLIEEDIYDFRKKINREMRVRVLDQLTRIHQLSKIKHISGIEKLSITNNSFQDVKISGAENETIIYLDPPYKSTTKYKEDLDHSSLREYIHSLEYDVYVSGYENVYDLKEIASFSHISTLSATNNSKKVEERLFYKVATK